MKLLLDMNLSPVWEKFLASHGIEAVHWSKLGDPRASDSAILTWAREHNFIVFTHDLEFSALIAHLRASGPSVLQVRTQDVLPGSIGANVLRVLREQATELTQGAIVTIDELTARVRILPIRGIRE